MNAAEAREWLIFELQPDTRPTINEAELDHLLSLAAVPDPDGTIPGGEDWEPTYSRYGLYTAAVRGWELKATKCLHQYTFSSDGQRFERAAVHTNCVRAAARARRRLSTTTRTGP